MEKAIKILFLLGIISTGGQAQELGVDYKIFAKSSRTEISYESFIQSVSTYKIIFWGEEHNDSIGHLLESKTLESLYDLNPTNLQLSLEMFDRDVQPIMDEYLAGWIKEKHFNKDARIWSNYSDYKPLIEFCKLNKIAIVCANAPSRYTNMAGRLGQASLNKISKEAKRFIAPLPYDTASGAYLEKIYIASGHGAPSSSDSTKKKMVFTGFNMNQGQSLWDATMAYSILERLKKKPSTQILNINGRFHSDEYFGIIAQIRNKKSNLDIANISCYQLKDLSNLNWANIENKNGDFIIVTKSNHSE